MKIYDIDVIDTKNFDIYDDFTFNNEFNEYNKKTSAMIEGIKDYCNYPFFKVPYYDKKMIWGKERIFYPFSDKLFKIIIAENDLSVQLHPLKREEWIPLVESNIFDGSKCIRVNSNQKIDIKPNTVHEIKKESMIFEIQDNMLFDDNETIRIYDSNGRKTDDFKNIYKYLMPQLKKEIKIYNIISENVCNDINFERDIFVFIINGKVSLNLPDKAIKLEDKQLYYINGEYAKYLKIYGNVYICNVNYYIITN